MKRTIIVRDELKYAKKDIRLCRKFTVALAVISAIFIVIQTLCCFEVITASVVIGISALGMLSCGLFFWISFYLYLDGKIYLKDLEKKGYIIPECRSDYIIKLSLLEKKECDVQDDSDTSEETVVEEGKINKRHFALAIVVGVITILTTMHSFTFAKRPHPLAIVVMFITTGILFWQSCNRFFKNDIDIEIVDSRWIRPRIMKSVMGVVICFFVLFIGAQVVNNLPTFNKHYYAQIVRHYKEESLEGYYFYLDRLPANAEEVRFISWGKACCVSFYVSQEELKDIQAHYEGLGESYVIHTMEEGEESFVPLCNEIKERTIYFRSEDYENCMVYEFNDFYHDQAGNPFSEYIIMDTKSGEVGYGYCPSDW